VQENSIRIWDPLKPEIKVPGTAYTCRNGYKLQRVNFGKKYGEVLIGITLTRLIFEAGSISPSFLSASEIFTKGKCPDVLRHEPMIIEISRIIQFLNETLSPRQIVRHNEYTAEYHAHAIIYRFGDRLTRLIRLIEPPGLSRNLLYNLKSSKAAIPAFIHLGVLSQNVRDPKKAMHIGEEVARVLEGWQCKISLDDLKDGQYIKKFIKSGSEGKTIVLVPLEGKKGDRPAASAIQWLKYFDSEKVAFQLCSTASNSIFSRHGLSTVILSKADGGIFVAEPEGFPDFHDSWFIGIDLGKGGMNKGNILVITLTGPSGSLQAYWRACKDNDETIKPGLLQDGLSWIAATAQSMCPGRHLYLIRDGIRPHHEPLDSYQKALADHDFTLIEYIKSGSPLIHHSPHEPSPGTAILPEASDFTALYPCGSPQDKVLTAPVKIRVPINPYQHSSSVIFSLLTALCHSATLSYQPSRLPAPIQWANGIARLSYTNLQFSGWSNRATRMVNMAEY
jgi:hypothetical protein